MVCWSDFFPPNTACLESWKISIPAHSSAFLPHSSCSFHGNRMNLTLWLTPANSSWEGLNQNNWSQPKLVGEGSILGALTNSLLAYARLCWSLQNCRKLVLWLFADPIKSQILISEAPTNNRSGVDCMRTYDLSIHLVCRSTDED